MRNDPAAGRTIPPTIDLSFTTMPVKERYKILCAAVTPRPIALVTTLAGNGAVNAAPFSFFNVFSDEPPLLVLGVDQKAAGGRKDTNANIRHNGHFVVHVTDEALAAAMNVCAIDFPPGESEIDAAGLTLAPSVDIPVPRIAGAAFAFECRLWRILPASPVRDLVIGEVLRVHARRDLLDPATKRIDGDAWRPIARLSGDGYAKLGERFAMTRETYAEWKKRRG
jgi:flavin reductase (DIM6/NTAB) family NADH-FMN oxidoreductase RutF